jgi:hypothetical protein
VEPNDTFLGGLAVAPDDKNPVLYTVEPTGPGFEPLIRFNLPAVTVNQQSSKTALVLVGILAVLFLISE